MSTPSNRRQSFIAQPGQCDVQYEGSKSFWKTRTNIDILIVNHFKYNCLEIICYDPERGNEASSRIYVNAALLISKIDQNELKKQLEDIKEGNLRQKKSFNASQLQKELLIAAMNTYISSRIQLDGDPSSGRLKVVLSPLTGDKLDEETKELDIITSLPTGLSTLSTCFQRKAK
jgi:hypothetical protein